MIVWRDGELVPASAAISAQDRGYLIGDAVFETILVDNGAPAFLDEHLARLQRGRIVLGIVGKLEASDVRQAIRDLAARNASTGRAACRLTVSRVGGARGLSPSADACVQTVLSLTPAPTPPAFVRLITASRRRWSGAAANGFKCVGAYADNLLARVEATEKGADEAIMLNEHGRVASASSANVFIAADAGLQTPPLGEGAMPGVVRGVILEEARRLGLPAIEAPIDPSMLAASTIILTNSIAGAVESALDGAKRRAGAEIAAMVIAAYEHRLAGEFACDRDGAQE